MEGPTASVLGNVAASGSEPPKPSEALGAIDLHFHDLRREAGSRWLEGGVPLHTVKDWLGHTNISQTSTYLNATRVGIAGRDAAP